VTPSTAASRRHGLRQVAVATGLVGVALVVLAGALAVAPAATLGSTLVGAGSVASSRTPAFPSQGVADATGQVDARDRDTRALVTSSVVVDRAPADVPTAAVGDTTPPMPATPAPEPVVTPSPADRFVPARPVSVEIPVIGVRSDLVGLDLDAERHLEVPSDPDVAGWYVRGPRPGQDGPAVIAGHVDSTGGPAVFWRLRDLRRGDLVQVHGGDGGVVTFAVDHVGRWPKTAFPTDEVYRRADGPELRLVTCGGTFDDRAGSYLDNVVVFASLAAPT